MRKINEVIIVEGSHDIAFLKTFLDADFIETKGFGFPEETKELILELANKGRNFIVLTDPDFPGEKIRKEIEVLVSNCKHAFIKKKNAISKNKKKVGVEHTSKEEVLEALESLISFQDIKEVISFNEYYELGFIGKENSKELRMKICEAFHLGHGSAKTIFNRINMLNISKEELMNKIKEVQDGKNSNC